MYNGLVSVIIPAYNRENTILRSIKSVLNQTYDNIEVIVIDDCSTDKTRDRVLEINDDRVRYYCLEKNSGACVARNTGVKIARGDIIAFQDSDDSWHLDKLEKQLNYLIENDYDFISCGIVRVNGDERKEYCISECPTEKIDVWCKLINSNWVSTQTILCYKSCFEKIQFDPAIKRYQDWDLALQASLIYKMGSMQEALVDVYIQENSISKTVNNIRSKAIVIEKHKIDVIDKNRKMMAQYFKCLADVNRREHPNVARGYYLKSLKNIFCLKVLVCWMLCFTPAFRFYNTRQ